MANEIDEIKGLTRAEIQARQKRKRKKKVKKTRK